MKEKEHEVYFYDQIKNHKLLPFFEKIFSWGATQSMNDIDITSKKTIENSNLYCKKKG